MFCSLENDEGDGIPSPPASRIAKAKAKAQAFFTNSDFNPIWPMPSTLQSMS